MVVALDAVRWDLKGINELLDQLMLNAVRDKVGGIAGNHAERSQDVVSQCISIIDALDGNQAGGIASGIAGAGIEDKLLKVLNAAANSATRSEILENLALSNRAKNFETYIQPLVAINWLTMTIPDKPTSPNQKYLTTLKGRLVLEFLKRNKK